MEVGVVGGEAKLYILGGEVEVDQGDVGTSVYFEDVLPVDDVVEGQVHGSQHVGLQPHCQFSLRLSCDLDYLSRSVLEDFVGSNVPFE